MSNAQVGGPGAVSIFPTAIDMVQLVVMSEISTIDGELVEGVQHTLHGVA